MKKIICVMVMSVLLLGFSVPVFADETTDLKQQIMEYMVLVNGQIGLELTEEELEVLETTVELSAISYSETYNIAMDEAYNRILEELKTEIPLSSEPSVCSYLEVTLPTASTGAIFYIDSESAWNHVGLYTSATTIVEAMPDDGVRYWTYNDAEAAQKVVTNPTDGVNNSCILGVNTTSAKKVNAAGWPARNITAGTPYDYDFLDNKQDIYFINIGTTDYPVMEQHYESDAYNCSELVWKAYYKAAGIDLDSNGGLAVYPNNIKNSSSVYTIQGNWW